MLSDNAIEELKKKFNPAAAKNFSATYLFAIQGEGGGHWLTTIADGKCEIVPHEDGQNIKPDCKISVSAKDLSQIMNGKLSAMTAALSGILSVEGELGLAMQLVPMFFEKQASII